MRVGLAEILAAEYPDVEAVMALWVSERVVCHVVGENLFVGVDGICECVEGCRTIVYGGLFRTPI
jgi:hypothetical protein